MVRKLRKQLLQLILCPLLLMYGASSTLGQIPTVCVSNATLANSGICCPIDVRTGQQCGSLERGKCGPLKVYQWAVPEVIEEDDRIHWPLRFFHTGCNCRGNFYGPACEYCWFGWTGQHCNQRLQKPIIRRDVRNYTTKQRARLLDLLVRSRTFPSNYSILVESSVTHSDPVINPVWEPASIAYFLAATHRYASRSTLFKNNYTCATYGVLDFNHNGLSFLLWHRYFILVWERMLRTIAETVYTDEAQVEGEVFAFPYWDWVDKTSCEICTNDLVGAEGKETDPEVGMRLDENSPFYNVTEYCRLPQDYHVECFGCHYETKPSSLTRGWNNMQMPTREELDYALGIANFFSKDELDTDNGCKSFHVALEGFCGPPGSNSSHLYLHNRVHNSVDGSFCCSGTSVNDPLFPIHHTQVDRILQTWWDKYKPSAVQALPSISIQFGQCLNCTLTAFYPIVEHSRLFGDIANLGYVYEHYHYGNNTDQKQNSFTNQSITSVPFKKNKKLIGRLKQQKKMTDKQKQFLIHRLIM